MSDLLDHVTAQENLCWAWLKAKRMYEQDDILTDDLEVAEFEMSLEESLNSIAGELRSGNYRLCPLLPMAHPKGRDDDGNHRIRQSFRLAVRDQVAWIAFVNIVGPSLEDKMPSWSYGNRLYRQLFFEPGKAGAKHLRFGHFRHAKGELYRPFHQAWPVYRRHILFTAKKMTGDRIVLDEHDDEFLEIELEAERVPYLQDGWWQPGYHEAYWATVDFRQFYPSIDLDIVLANLCRFCAYPMSDVRKLLDQLLHFPLADCGWPDDALQQVQLVRGQDRVRGIPTGMFVSGFLANVAMLAIDGEVYKRLRRRQIAQFRYVDDHTVLAPSYQALNDWLDEYVAIVKEAGLGTEINETKTEPAALKDCRISPQKEGEKAAELDQKAKEATRINIRMPTPLLTKTLAKVSMIAQAEVDLQTLEEQDALLADVEQLLLTEFPTEELRPDTRVSFAMSQLCKVAAKRFLHSRETWQVEEEIAAFIDSYKGGERPGSPKLSELQKKRDDAIDKQFLRLFELIEMTLERCPDRPRLWAKAVRFCLRTGFAPGLKKLFELLRRLGDLHPLSVKYMESFLLQRVNRYFLQALSRMLRVDQPLCQRSAAVRFANGCYELAEKSGCTRQEAANVVRLYWECQSAYWMFSQSVKSRRRNAYNLAEVHLFLYQQGLLTTMPTKKKRIPPSTAEKQAQEAAHWHVDGKITPFASTRPSFYWGALSSRLAPSRPGDSMLLAKWPSFLPAKARAYFLRHLKRAAPGRLGWFAAMGASASGRVGGRRPGALSKLSLNRRQSRKYMTLHEWVEFAGSLEQWDPRRSEWTALEIVRQALRPRLAFGARRRKKQALVPHNILVPLAWKQDPSKRSQYTWESWDSLARDSRNTIILRSTRSVDDDRYAPFWQSSKPRDEWEDVYSCGLVLLGLLRLSFELPCSWNPEGQLRLWGWGMGRVLSETPCSSWTLAILQATVMPRNRETFILRRLNQSRFCRDDDTVNDPPEMPTVDALDSFVSHSQRVLHMHRVTVQDHKPRQLIPLSLDQIGRALFADGNGGASE